MIVVKRVDELKAIIKEWKKQDEKIGFVPTMGCLHDGHLSLIRESRRLCSKTVVSIFVNPSQFGPEEDFDRYPRNILRDLTLLEKESADCVFVPDVVEVYPPGYKTGVEVHDLQDKLCGKSRPGHFRGVATVVLKLFNMVSPDRAFFGRKDAQQVVIIKQMVKDLNLPVEIVACPIVRESDGLAMSSRNSYLSPEERKAALVLSQSLQKAAGLVAAGERESKRIINAVRSMVNKEPLARLDYVEVVDLNELRPLIKLSGDVLIALAVYIGRTRLIDNIQLSIQE